MSRGSGSTGQADQVRMARDVATMFDELKTLADRHAELHADRARLKADVDRFAVEAGTGAATVVATAVQELAGHAIFPKVLSAQ